MGQDVWLLGGPCAWGACRRDGCAADEKGGLGVSKSVGYLRNDVVFFNLVMVFILVAFTTAMLYTPAVGSMEMFVPLACMMVNVIVAYNMGLQKGMLLSIALTFVYGSYVIYNAGMNGNAADVKFAHILWMIFFPVAGMLGGNLSLVVGRYKKEMESKKSLEKLVAIDENTGFYKEGEFFKQLDEEFVRAKRYKTPLSVLIIQITNYEELEIIYGEVDMVAILKTVSEYLCKSLRFCDGKFLIADDALSVILTETDEAGARVVLEKLHLTLEQITTTIGDGVKKVVRIKPSIGFASLMPERDRDSLEIYERAKSELTYDKG